MNDADSTPKVQPGELPADASAEQIRADRDETLERMSATVEELAAKADVKSQAKEAAHQAKAGAQHKVSEGSEKVKKGADKRSAPTGAGPSRPRPAPWPPRFCSLSG